MATVVLGSHLWRNSWTFRAKLWQPKFLSQLESAEVALLIASAGFRVLTFDNRGQNESSHSKRSDGYSMSSLGRDVIEISQQFGLQEPHLLGHSFGGLITQQAVKLSPNNWSSLTLMCSGPGGRCEWLKDPQFENLTNKSKGEIWENSRDFECPL
jgi:pimeloyl-ACP methyl ester carboxylesterase